MLTVESFSSLTPLYSPYYFASSPFPYIHQEPISSLENPSLMGTQHLMATASLCDLFHESDLCSDEILTILQSLDDDNNINIFNMDVSSAAGRVPEDKKRKKPGKTASSSSPGLGSDEESDKDDHAVLSQRKSFKRQKISLSPPPTSMDDGSGEDGGTAGRSFSNGKLVSHVAVERNRRKQMNEHLAVLRQLMPCFYVKKGDQASIVGGVIDYITELQQVLQSLEAKKQRKIYTGEVGQSPRIVSSPRLLAPQQHLNPSPLLSPRPLLGSLPISPRTPQSSSIRSPTSNSCSDMIMMMMKKKKNRNSNNGVANELVASSKSSIADVEVKFCGPNLELKTLSSKIAGQTVKIVSAIEDLSLEILQLSINTADETLLNTFTIKIGIECQLSAEELAQQIQQTFC